MSIEASALHSAPKKARAKKPPAAAAKASTSTPAPAKAQVIVLGSRKARSGRYQVLAPVIPIRHASADQLDTAVRLVLAAR